jgi:hypothetical protein
VASVLDPKSARNEEYYTSVQKGMFSAGRDVKFNPGLPINRRLAGGSAGELRLRGWGACSAPGPQDWGVLDVPRSRISSS